MSYSNFQLTQPEIDRLRAKNAKKSIRAYIKQHGTEPSDISSFYTATNAELEHYRRVIYAEQMTSGDGGGSVSPTPPFETDITFPIHVTELGGKTITLKNSEDLTKLKFVVENDILCSFKMLDASSGKIVDGADSFNQFDVSVDGKVITFRNYEFRGPTFINLIVQTP